MRRIVSLWVLGFVMALAWGAAPAFSASELAAPALLEVTGMLEGVTLGEQGEIVTLNVYGKLASGPLSSDCRFQDERGAEMEKGAFLRRYMKRVITLELEEDSGAVVLFRVNP